MTLPDSPTLRHCTACDTAIPSGARFCVECGAPTAHETAPPHAAPAPFAAAGQRCTTCATTNPTSAVYCVNCGTGLNRAPVGYAPAGYAPAFAGVGAGTTMVQNVYITNAIQPPLPLAVRALWFLFIGLWLGPLWIVVGWLLNLTLIGMPLGLWMLNRTGNVMTLRREPLRQSISLAQSSASLVVRAVYFVLIGWWVSLIWLMFGWLAAATVIGLPIAFLMFERTGTVMTLADA